MMKLYVYDHCPYCVRARMIFGLKQLPFQLEIMLNDDEATPISMVGKKMVPILQKEDGTYMPESMDIVQYVDKHYGSPVLTGATSSEMTQLAQALDCQAFRQLVSPRYVKLDLPEFATESARHYFIDKKQVSLGLFSDCLAQTETLIQTIAPLLNKLDSLLKSEQAGNGTLSTDDIYLFPILRNLSIVKGLVFPKKVHAYMESMAKQSQVDLYFDRVI